MNVTEALKARISVRNFLDKPVDEALVRDLLDRARWSPSGGNMQPWKVIAISGEARDAVIEIGQAEALKSYTDKSERQDRDFPVYPSQITEPYKSRRSKVAEDMYAILDIPREDRMARLGHVARNYQFFGAPVGLFFVIDRQMGRGQWAHLGMFMQSLALVAVEQGLATCMQEAWAFSRQSLAEHFGLPDHEVIYCGMALGWPDRDAPLFGLRSERAEVDEFATFKGFRD